MKASGRIQTTIAIFASVIVVGAIAAYMMFFRNPVVARVGDYVVHKQDVIRRDQINRIFYPQVKTEHGLEQLIKSYTYAQILKNHSRAITDAMIRQEEIRIDNSTRDPETLAKIKAVFDGDMDAYRRIFVLPNLAQQLLPNFFENDQTLQQVAYQRANTILQKIKQQPSQISQIADQEKLSIQSIRASKSLGIFYDTKDNSRMFGDTSQFPLWESETRQLQPNGVVPVVLEFNSKLLVGILVKRISREDFILKVIEIPKVEFFEWAEKEKSKLIIRSSI